MKKENYDNIDKVNLDIFLNYLKQKGKIIDFSQHNFFGHVFYYFLLDDKNMMEHVESTFKKYNVNEFGVKSILSGIA